VLEDSFNSPKATPGKYGEAIGITATGFIDDGLRQRRGCRGLTARRKENQITDQDFAHKLLLPESTAVA
jgi:hypothetical protein